MKQNLVSIEVFKTNISTSEEAAQLTRALLLQFPHFKIHFDLEDCDKILKIEGGRIHPVSVINVAYEIGYDVEVLPDEV